MKSPLLIIFLFIFLIKSYGIEITGRITDSETGQPIEYAAVYINGTTIGTTSDTDGRFSLKYNIENCRIVINHVSYEYLVVDITPENCQDMKIKLIPKNFEIDPLLVQSENLRAQSMAHFKKLFLGDNFWGENAKILNDSVLVFHTEYFGNDVSNKDLVGEIKCFQVKATAPLLIDMPKLGYLLQYNMAKFMEAYDPQFETTVLNNLGYTYFREYEDASRLQEMRFRRNRYKVYYHSMMHFVRSLYENKLEDNGYDVFIETKRDSIKTYTHFLPDSCGCITYNNDEAFITGIKGSMLVINYFSNNYKPINLAKNKNDANWRILSGITPTAFSILYIGKDTCIIRKDGTLPGGGELIFKGDITKKRYGALLPSDFEP